MTGFTLLVLVNLDDLRVKRMTEYKNKILNFKKINFTFYRRQKVNLFPTNSWSSLQIISIEKRQQHHSRELFSLQNDTEWNYF